MCGSKNIIINMAEIRQIVKGANIVEGTIFDIGHRKDADYQKFIKGI